MQCNDSGMLHGRRRTLSEAWRAGTYDARASRWEAARAFCGLPAWATVLRRMLKECTAVLRFRLQRSIVYKDRPSSSVLPPEMILESAGRG